MDLKYHETPPIAISMHAHPEPVLASIAAGNDSSTGPGGHRLDTRGRPVSSQASTRCFGLLRRAARRREVVAGCGRANPGGPRSGSPTLPPRRSPPCRPNITENHRRAFDALTRRRFDNICLVSCFVDGESTAAIATVNPPAEDDGEPHYLISPLFICPTAAMTLTDHDGRDA